MSNEKKNQRSFESNKENGKYTSCDSFYNRNDHRMFEFDN